MKKHIICLLTLIMVLSPVAAFAQEGEFSDEAASTEDQVVENIGEYSVDDSVNQYDEEDQDDSAGVESD